MIASIMLAALAATVGVFTGHLIEGKAWTTGGGVVALTVATLVWTRADRSSIVRVLAPVLLVATSTGLLVQAIRVVSDGPLGRAAGFLVHPNIAAATAIAGWALVVALLDHVRLPRRGAAVLIVVASGLAAFLLLAAGSRSVILGAALGVVVVAALWRRRGGAPAASAWLWYGLASLLLAGIVAGAVTLRPDVGRLLGSFERGPIFMAGLDIALRSPWVGAGDGAWISALSDVEPALPPAVAPHAHSVPLTLLIEGGAIGMVGVSLLACLLLGVSGWRWRRQASLGTAALLVGLVAIGTQGLVDTVFMYYPSVYLPVVAASWAVHAGGPAK